MTAKTRWLLLAVAVVLAGCVNEDAAAHALRGAGYTDVQYTGYKWGACSDDDTYHTGFTAKGPTGVVVTGTVCSGWMKGSTIRLDW